MPAEPIRSLADLLDDPPPDPTRRRLLLLGGLMALGFVGLAGRLWHLQIAQGEQLRRQAVYQRLRQVEITPTRGVIVDRNGLILARNRPTCAVGVVPADLPRDPLPVYRRLERLLGVPAAMIQQKVVQRRTDLYTPIIVQSDVRPEVVYQIEERRLDLPGVHVLVEGLRDYPEGPVTAHLLGYVGPLTEEQYQRLQAADPPYRFNDRVGQAGLEQQYEPVLRGRPGRKGVEVDPAGREVRVLEVRPAQPGYNLVLTVDLPLQREAVRLLSEDLPAVESASVVALDPRNGQVLALVHLPSYDSNRLVRGLSLEEFAALQNDPRAPLLNGALTFAFPPGGVFHVLTGLAGLSRGVIRPTTQIVCTGGFTLRNRYNPGDDAHFPCWGVHGPQDMVSALANSCQTYFYQVGGGDPRGDRPGVGIEALADLARAFGLGAPTGIDLPGEGTGLVPTPAWKRQVFRQDWYRGDTYMVSVGQGPLTVTPLQLAVAIAAIANGGTVYQPQVVQKIVDAQGQVVRPFAPRPIRRLSLDPAALAAIRQGLRATFQRGQTPTGARFTGLALGLAPGGLDLAGVAGQAEGLVDGRPVRHGWFAGFAPAGDPLIAVAVFLRRSQRPEQAARVGAGLLRLYLTGAEGPGIT